MTKMTKQLKAEKEDLLKERQELVILSSVIG